MTLDSKETGPVKTTGPLMTSTAKLFVDRLLVWTDVVVTVLVTDRFEKDPAAGKVVLDELNTTVPSIMVFPVIYTDPPKMT